MRSKKLTTLASLLQPSEVYPQLQTYIQRSTTSTLCLGCKKNCECSWMCEGKPVEGWEAKETQLCTCGKGKKIRSYKVNYCPEFKQTADYYSTDSDMVRLMAYRLRVTPNTLTNRKGLVKRLWRAYSKACPRSANISEEDRSRILRKIYEKLLEKMRKEKLEKKREEKRKKTINELYSERSEEDNYVSSTAEGESTK